MNDSVANAGKEMIGFDEFMDGGIPDALLEGLGFYENEEDDEEEAEEGGESKAVITKAEMDCSQNGESTTAPLEQRIVSDGDVKVTPPRTATTVDPQRLSRLRSHRTPKISSNLPSKEVSVSPVKQPAKPQCPVPIQRAVYPSSSNRVPQISGSIVVKGNIMYERTATGEVIASVVKNGIPKQSLTNSIVPPTVPPSTASFSVTPRCSPSVGIEVRSSGLSSASGLLTLPEDCPLNENNVESVLDQSIAATQAVRRTLSNLKDDLRRMGGGPTVTPALKPIHIQHRIDVAQRLANAFVQYRDIITKISCFSEAENKSLGSVTGAENAVPFAVVNVSASQNASSGIPNKVTAAHHLKIAERRLSHDAAGAATSSPQSTQIVSVQPPSKRKLTSSVLPVNKRSNSSAEVESIVSDDLLMSCEPCD